MKYFSLMKWENLSVSLRLEPEIIVGSIQEDWLWVTIIVEIFLKSDTLTYQLKH